MSYYLNKKIMPKKEKQNKNELNIWNEFKNSQNILLVGNSGSGKTYCVDILVSRYLDANKKVFLLNYSSLDRDGETLLTQVAIDLLVDQSDNRLPENFKECTYDVIVIDELQLLSEPDRIVLFNKIRDRPGIKFVVTAQNWSKRDRDLTNCFERIYLGKIQPSLIPNLQKVFKLSSCELQKCVAIENFNDIAIFTH